MAKRKLSTGTHTVIIKGKQRRVRVNAKGQWKFLKGSSHSSTPRKARGAPRRKAAYRGGRRMARRNGSWKRKAGFVVPSIAGGIILLDAGSRLGWWVALSQLMQGGSQAFSNALGTVVANAKLGNVLVPAAAAVGVAIARKAVGPVKLAKVGRWNLRVL